MIEKIISVGIDLGTSTTKLIFSRLHIENLASCYSVPQIEIVNKEIIFESEIAFTEMITESEIDLIKAKNFIEKQYKLAQIDYKDVSTGALIITGESARKENADKALEALSEVAGEFVVATAGPALESVLSGLGATADVISKEKNINMINIDIGGGTSNISYFSKGRLVGVTCMDIGGRLITVDKEKNKITYVFKKIKALARNNNIDIEEGDNIDICELNKIAELMADIIFQAINLKVRGKEFNKYLTNDEKPLNKSITPEGISFSGGIGHCIYSSKDADDIFKFGDIGILLADKIKKHKSFYKVDLYMPKETQRATVIGAGMYTTEISGSTICINNDELPLKNIPIIKLDDSCIESISKICSEQIKIYLTDISKINKGESVAIAFPGYAHTSFKAIDKLAEEIIKGAEILIEKNKPLIVIIENDIGKALGNALSIKLKGYRRIICIDKINTSSGDYIDIGKAVALGQAVPVIVKTLIFNT